MFLHTSNEQIVIVESLRFDSSHAVCYYWTKYIIIAVILNYLYDPSDNELQQLK